LYPVAARNNQKHGIDCGPQYKIGYINGEDKTPYWELVQKRSNAIQNAEGSSDGGGSPSFPVEPVKSNKENFNSVRKKILDGESGKSKKDTQKNPNPSNNRFELLQDEEED
jgi:hypothetical protein